jgi:pimeloyl-ACP methyl ester carboxylesterase
MTLRLLLQGCLLAALFLSPFTQAAAPAPVPGFATRSVDMPDGATIFVRAGGSGPAVVLIHGFGDTGDMWGPLAERLAKTHTVIAPDLRGMGRSSRAASGYAKKAQAQDIRAVLTAFKVDRADVVGHDIGTMVAYAYAASYPDKVNKLVVMDAPVPGIPPWNQLVLNPKLWHFNFGGPDAERLVAGRERIYLDRLLAIGGEQSFGATMAEVMRNAATNVTGAVVSHSGHWLMEKNPDATVKLVSDFLETKNRQVRN